MRVGVYVPDVGPESGGALTFIRSVLGALAAAPCAHEFHVLYSGPTPPEGSVGLPRLQVPDRTSQGDSTLDAAANDLRLDVLWFLAPGPAVSLPFIATVWDLEHRNQPYFPEVSVSGWTWEKREDYYRSTLPRAACVVVGTNEGKRQIERFYAVPASLIAVVPFLTPSFLPEELQEDPERFSELGIRSPFLFYPAQFWPHKNHAVLLHALRALNDQGQYFDLVLTGSDKGNLGHVRAMASTLGLDDQVQFLGFIDRRTVAMLYRNALALLFPSFFGPDNLPPLEAFALGCPVVTAAVPGTKELFGDAAILLDPTDETAWANAVLALFRDPQRRAELARRGLAHSSHSTPIDYVRDIASRLDAFEPIRRCWSRNERYVHPHNQSTGEQESEAELKVQLDTIRALQHQLAVSEADRAARLEVIHTLEHQLSASETDRAARLEVIHTLEHRLAASEADRAAHLETTEAVRARLEARHRELEEVRVELEQARSHSRAIELSRTWRWTGPVRAVLNSLIKRTRRASP